MGNSFRRPPTADPPAVNRDTESVDYVPRGEAGSALASVNRIAKAVPYRKIQRKEDSGEEKAKAADEPEEEKDDEKEESEEKKADGEKSDAAEAKGGEAETKEEAPPIAAKLEGIAPKVFLAGDGPPKLTAGGRKKLGNLADMQAMTVADAIKARGGGAGQARMAGPWAQKSLAETANAAAAGDETAETAIKMVKQASAKAGDHSGRSG